MSVYFQKIAEKSFDANGSFLVKESKHMHLFIGTAFLVLSIIMMIQSSTVMGVIAAIFSLASFITSQRESVIMKINKDGFYYYGDLVTHWQNFVSARFVDETPTLSGTSTGLTDQFYVVLRYYKDQRPECYERKFRLTNTQDKSEEEILAAIRFYYKDSQLAS